MIMTRRYISCIQMFCVKEIVQMIYLVEVDDNQQTVIVCISGNDLCLG